MASKLIQTKFNKKIEKIILSLGGNQVYATLDGYQRFTLPTKAGELSISLHTPEASKLFSIFTCFEDVKKANDLLKNDDRLNIHSGKYNHHYTDMNLCLEIFTKNMEAIL